jgi:hypothetical protein
VVPWTGAVVIPAGPDHHCHPAQARPLLSSRQSPTTTVIPAKSAHHCHRGQARPLLSSRPSRRREPGSMPPADPIWHPWIPDNRCAVSGMTSVGEGAVCWPGGSLDGCCCHPAQDCPLLSSRPSPPTTVIPPKSAHYCHPGQVRPLLSSRPSRRREPGSMPPANPIWHPWIPDNRCAVSGMTSVGEGSVYWPGGSLDGCCCHPGLAGPPLSSRPSPPITVIMAPAVGRCPGTGLPWPPVRPLPDPAYQFPAKRCREIAP